MTRYLISFEDGTMVIPDEELAEVSRAAHAVVQEAKDAGAWIHGGGIDYGQTSTVDTDGSVTDGPFAAGKERLGGFSIVDVATREEALAWAAKLAVACRCPQDVRELMHDPDA